MDKLTAELARACARARNNAPASEKVTSEMLYGLYDQLADALEAKERADNEAKQARQAEAAAYADAEIAESRLKEAMRAIHPGETPPPYDSGEPRVYRSQTGGWYPAQYVADRYVDWCVRADLFECAFGVKVEEWKP